MNLFHLLALLFTFHSDLHQKYNESQTLVRQLQSNLETLNNSQKIFQAKLNRQQKFDLDLASLKEQYEQMKTAYNAHKSQYEEEKRVLEAEKLQLIRTSESLKQNNETLEQELSITSSELKSSVQRIKLLEKQLLSLTTSIETLKKDLDQKELIIDAQRSELGGHKDAFSSQLR